MVWNSFCTQSFGPHAYKETQHTAPVYFQDSRNSHLCHTLWDKAAMDKAPLGSTVHYQVKKYKWGIGGGDKA